MQHTSSFFDQLRENMSPETIHKYQQIGQHFFSNFDFDTGYMYRKDQLDKIDQIISALKSGLNPEDLSDDEVEVMKDKFGTNWEENSPNFLEYFRSNMEGRMEGDSKCRMEGDSKCRMEEETRGRLAAKRASPPEPLAPRAARPKGERVRGRVSH